MSGSGDCIFREDIVNGVNDLFWNSNRDYEPHEIILALHDMIADIPDADVRPVVLCRDCNFFKPQQKSRRWSNTTPMCSRSATIKMPPDGFCSFGVKREES